MKEGTGAWAFSRTGGVDQVVLRNGEDIGRLGDLDQKLWAVLAMPASQHDYAEVLTNLDADGDGKIRVPDILRAIGELKIRLLSLDPLFEQNDLLKTSQIGDGSLRDAAASVAELNSGGEKSPGIPESVTLAEVDKAIASFAAMPFNGDGVIVPASVKKEAVRSTMETVIGAGYSAMDSSGVPGVGNAELDHFVEDAKAVLAWRASDPSSSGGKLEAKAPRALELYRTLKDRIEDYFRRCELVALSESPDPMHELRGLMASMLSREVPADDPDLARIPLALPAADAVLRLDRPLHPAFAALLKEFAELVAQPFGLGSGLDLGTWRTIAAELDAYATWVDSAPVCPAATLPSEALLSIIGSDSIAALRTLIGQDAARDGLAGRLHALRLLILYKRDFLSILQNFVNLDSFYKKKDGVFQSGRLYLDGRELEFCLDVKNPGAHGSMAGLSSMYLVYCDLSKKDGRKKSIVAALTAGDADNVFVGRNGIFYDSEGEDWDAVITKLVVQPISIREAFFSPYKWFVRTLEEMAMKRAAAAEGASMDKMKGAAAAAAQANPAAMKPETLPSPKKMDVGTVAAIGVALGSIGAMVTAILGLFFGMGVWMPLGILGIVLLISGPSMILAYLKLRKRNIGPLLNAEGWAVNSRLKINVPFGATLSHLGVLPAGSSRQLVDPFAEKKKPWGLYLGIVIVVGVAIAAYFLGWLDPFLGR